MAPDYWAKLMLAEALTSVLRLPATFTPHIRTPLLVAAYAHAGQQKKAKELLAAYEVRPVNMFQPAWTGTPAPY